MLRRVYLWVTLGLLTTTGTATLFSTSPLFRVLAGPSLTFFGLLTAELVLVIGISWSIKRISSTTTLLLFFAYAVLNGLTLSVMFVVYTLGSITSAFLASAALFGVMSIIGYTTKLDLTKIGSFLRMGMLGLFITMLVNLFWANSTLDMMIIFVGIILFLGLTIIDTQRIKRMTEVALQQCTENVKARFTNLKE